ncbi:hypothetical protein DUNSADRAFT_16496 [Dunaliella salina]|uniref:Uncharacterized protein n=1 Tax=Dunaliella salina TaxID=3046 RepID=A0ABQ7G3G9_DUNSA|nr:hypothetical protein DUNSADRAFT_16496 [Dunaliella salina]|eukprot:KAF5829154.1 hypothetical protein DUNSADRAFT_16496 [Dunaliella salina]
MHVSPGQTDVEQHLQDRLMLRSLYKHDRLFLSVRRINWVVDYTPTPIHLLTHTPQQQSTLLTHTPQHQSILLTHTPQHQSILQTLLTTSLSCRCSSTVYLAGIYSSTSLYPAGTYSLAVFPAYTHPSTPAYPAGAPQQSISLTHTLQLQSVLLTLMQSHPGLCNATTIMCT